MKFDADFYSAISRVIEAKTDSFTALVKLAGLDPQTDFRNLDLSGVDFSKANLSGFDFTGSDLSGCNFRGSYIANAKLPESTLPFLQVAADFDEYIQRQPIVESAVEAEGSTEISNKFAGEIEGILKWTFPSPNASDLRWVVIATFPDREIAASRSLKKKGFSAYCPVQRLISTKKVESPFFLRHIFVETEGTAESLDCVMDAFYVDSLIFIDNSPAFLPREFIEEIKNFERSGFLPNSVSLLFDTDLPEFGSNEFGQLVSDMINVDPELRLVLMRSLLRDPDNTHQRADIYEID